MRHDTRKGWALIAFGLGFAGSLAGAQVISRDTKVTGPKGKSVERQIRSERRPDGSIDRSVKIQRPGGTFERDTRIERGGYGPGGGGGGGYRPGGPRVIEHNTIVERNYYGGYGGPRYGYGPPRTQVGVGLPFFNFFLGSPPPPPPPVYVVPEPVYVAPAPPPTVVYQPPVRYAPPPEPETVVVDPVVAAADRLKSHHDNSRRDGALTLGRLGDARAVPVLVDRLNRDGEKEVRVAAAWALGEIGDPRAALPLQKASLYDRKQDVRDAASVAYRKLDRAPINDPNVQFPDQAPSGEAPINDPNVQVPAPLPPNDTPPPDPQPLPDTPR